VLRGLRACGKTSSPKPPRYGSHFCSRTREDRVAQVTRSESCDVAADARSGQHRGERADGEGDSDGVRGPGAGAARGAAEREEGGVLAERRRGAVVHVPEELLPRRRRLVPPRQLQLPPPRVQRWRPAWAHARAHPQRRARRQHVQRRRRQRRLPDHVMYSRERRRGSCPLLFLFWAWIFLGKCLGFFFIMGSAQWIVR
jgi:hypothetical protein